MNIAYLSCVYPPYPGGIGVAAQGMAKEMTRRGYEVVVLTPKLSFVESDKAKLYRVDWLRPWLKYSNAAVCPQLLWRLRSFDIIHLLYPFYGVAELLPLLRRTTRAKIVVHHMMDAVAPGLRGRFFKWHTQHLAPRIFRAADRVLVLSEDYYQNSWLTHLSFPQEKLSVVPHGVEIADIQNSILDINDQSEYPISNIQYPTILFVGGLDRAHYFKGVPVLIEACRILKDRGVKFQCQIVGDGDMRKEYEEQAKVSGVPPGQRPSRAGGRCQVSGVEFLGLVAHDKLPAYYQRAAVCVVPSTEPIECFSIVAAEAQACGIPVIVTDFPGVRVTIEHSKTGFVVHPRDAQGLAERLQWILEHPPEAQAMGAAGRARVEQMYSWKVVGDRLEGLYKELL